MTSLNDLFDWILEDILLLLPRHDRLTCKAVCKRWYDIMMERPTFREDRHIYIRTSEIEADEDPMIVLTQTRKPYEIYTVDDDTETKDHDYLHLFGFIGASIEEIYYPINGKCNDIFMTMPNLKSLKMEYVDLDDAEIIFYKIKSVKPDFIFHHMERVEIGEVPTFYTALDQINYIKECIPQNCAFIVSHVEVSNNKQFNHLCRLMEVTKIIKMSFGDKKEMEKLLGENNIKCDEFILEFKPEENPYFTVQAIQNKYRDLKKINLSCSFLPPIAIDLPKVTSLSLSLHFTSLQSLKHLPNLEHLNLKPLMNGCGFDHKSLSLPTLKKFELEVKTLCDECKLSLSNSFDNLEDFTMIGLKKFLWNEFRKLIDKWENVTSITIGHDGFRGKIEYENESLIFVPKNKITSICFLKFPEFETSDVKMVFESFPNLEELKLIERKVTTESISKILQEFAPTYTKLKSFIVNTDDYYSHRYDFRNDNFYIIHDSLKKSGYPIKDIKSARNVYFADSFVLLKFDRNKKITQMFKINKNLLKYS